MASEGHFVYILQCKDDSLYTGYTTNITRRLDMHTDGKGAKYTRGRGPFILMLSESYPTKECAMKREYEIKKLSRAKKIKLIEERQVLPDDPRSE